MKLKFLDRGVESLRQPDRLPRCYELTDEERVTFIKRWKNYNFLNSNELPVSGNTKIKENRNA